VDAYNHTCALLDGSVGCWGLNSYGQTDVSQAAGLVVTQVSAGFDHTCAVTQHNLLKCWGLPAESQIPLG